MPSTPTSYNRIEQQGQGENLNSWGDDKLNQALRKLDKSISDVVTIHLTGDHVLVTSNYSDATDEAASAVLKFTGSPAPDTSVILPDIEHRYLVHNSAAVAVTVRTATGTGITLPAASGFAEIYCDGAEIINAAPTIFGNRRLSEVATPVVGTDAATKAYVDAATTDLSATSETAVTVGTGPKAFTFTAGKRFVAGHQVLIVADADPNGTFMVGSINSYDPSTGAAIVNVTAFGGSGLHSDWTLSLRVLPAGIDDVNGLQPALADLASDIAMKLELSDAELWGRINGASLIGTI